jgi:hypothetical protein
MYWILKGRKSLQTGVSPVKSSYVRPLQVMACAFLLLSPAKAIVIDDYTIGEAPPSDVGYTLDWDYAYRVNATAGGTGVAVDPYWLLTAAHVADDKVPAAVTIGATTHTAAEVQYAPAGVDLALLRFSTPIFSDGHYEVYTGTFPAPPPPQTQRLTGLIVGYGREGTVSDTYYTPLTTGANIKRWGTNMIDGTANGLSAQGFTSDTIYMNFDLSDSPYEAGAAIYDSGGPVFVNDGGTWKVAGINVAIDATRGGTPSGSVDRIYAVSLPAYESWIMTVIPEPNTILLFGIAGLAAVRLRRRAT